MCSTNVDDSWPTISNNKGINTVEIEIRDKDFSENLFERNPICSLIYKL